MLTSKSGSRNPFYNSREWRVMRFRVLHRDGYKCVICGSNVRGKGLSRVDHIKPLKKFPELSLVLSNLRTLCVSCDNKNHSEKGGAIRNEVNEQGYPAGWE
jgi:5-methylcytosine-specific restriction endonuclease McrA